MKKLSKNKGVVSITGPDGMLGSNIVRELLHQGYTVKAMVQPGRKPVTIEKLPNVKIVFGDLLNSSRVRRLMAGCHYVIHVAAYTAPWPTRSQKYFDVNVTGTQHMIDAALYHKVSRFVQISSSNTQGFTSSKKQPGKEGMPWPGDQGMDYMLTKHISHKLVEDAIRNENLPALLICPGFMIGPYDTGPTSGQLLVQAWNNPLNFCTRGGKNFVAARDVATASVNAITMGRIGESYICGHKNLEFRELFQCIEDVTGKPQPRLVVPGFMVVALGWIMELIGKITRKKPLLTFAMARGACLRMYYNQNKAIHELKLPQTDLMIAMRDAYRWFGEHKYLKEYETH